MITEIDNEFKQAMRDKNSLKLNVLRALKTSITNTRIAKYPNSHQEIEELEILQIIRKEISKRKDSIDAYLKANRQDLIDIETSEIQILSKYIPEDLSDDKLSEIIDSAIADLNASSKKDMGKVIKQVVDKVCGRADNKKISTLVGLRLQ